MLRIEVDIVTNPTKVKLVCLMAVAVYHVQLLMGDAENVVLQKDVTGPFTPGQEVELDVATDWLLPAAWPIGAVLRFGAWGDTPSGPTPVVKTEPFNLVIPAPTITLVQ